MQALGKLLGGTLLTALVALSAGCALDSRVDLHFSGSGSIVVDERSQSVELDSHRSSGVTTRRRVVGINCSVTIAYDANDIGGRGVIVQTRIVRLHTRRRPRGTAYNFDCSGRTRFALLTRPDTLPDGDYSVDISFGLSSSRAFREKMVYAASVSCGNSKYVEPIIPAVSRMKRVPALKITPSAGSYRFSLPRIAGTRETGVPVRTQRRLSCAG